MRLVRAVALLWVPVLLAGTAAACGGTDPEPERNLGLTFYQDAPVLSPVDVGAPGNSPGDAYYFSANLHATAGGPVIGEVFGTKTLVKQSAPGANAEQRATMLYFTFNDRKDQIVVAGVPDYRADTPEFDPNVPVVRAVLGGTGKYFNAEGELTSIRNPDGTYRQDFRLVK